ncbi:MULTISPECIES: hypothetical protein [unclassified Paracoccus (in: a-proteobacteria)]|uniref:hypothetical protein n=1 Tax=unclassified Paracoccus (in: a-proteobacteria) TaxID=2688777 RepID=UPI0012B1EF17|nr:MULTISPECIES: hypothetical protein [unclassified Paracoccus (in: a-proteobacteria)]UXU73689.1 hypothetical protein GB879_006980 [Paracoccus sp. SMMA_5]UXU79578.1 hypothetical protein GB880_006965 [Paracoccus sp. SMMA_5_TC]
MTADDFNDWLDRTGLSGLQAAEALGIAKNSVVKYRREGAPRHIALACTAIYHNLGAWRKGHDQP